MYSSSSVSLRLEDNIAEAAAFWAASAASAALCAALRAATASGTISSVGTSSSSEVSSAKIFCFSSSSETEPDISDGSVDDGSADEASPATFCFSSSLTYSSSLAAAAAAAASLAASSAAAAAASAVAAASAAVSAAFLASSSAFSLRAFSRMLPNHSNCLRSFSFFSAAMTSRSFFSFSFFSDSVAPVAQASAIRRSSLVYKTLSDGIFSKTSMTPGSFK
mmetsp:Transcript_22857/g.32254  ORF Transcript_22857/g.32254 Transcript_22857/m.32254 type:complete len:221 (+) Transcript_22857:451-1113(+)